MSLAQVKYERFTWIAPLGLRFWDVALNMPVISGLVVTACPQAAFVSPSARLSPSGIPAWGITATVSPSGVYGFTHLPGLREFEIGRGDGEFWRQQLSSRMYVISVVDTLRRFLPCTFEIKAPAQGFAGLSCLIESPPASALESGVLRQAIPLFSSPARVMPSTLAVIRAELLDAETGKPASGAILEAHLKSKCLAWSVADTEGKITLFFPYPDLQEDSPPARKPLREQSWTLTITAKYSRPDSESPPATNELTKAKSEEPFSLCQVLDQKSALLLQNLSPLTPLTETQLKFGQECVLKSPLWVQLSP